MRPIAFHGGQRSGGMLRRRFTPRNSPCVGGPLRSATHSPPPSIRLSPTEVSQSGQRIAECIASGAGVRIGSVLCCSHVPNSRSNVSAIASRSAAGSTSPYARFIAGRGARLAMSMARRAIKIDAKEFRLCMRRSETQRLHISSPLRASLATTWSDGLVGP